MYFLGIFLKKTHNFFDITKLVWKFIVFLEKHCEEQMRRNMKKDTRPIKILLM
jgi:hypothetical protein